MPRKTTPATTPRQKPGRKIRPSVHLELDLPALTRRAMKAAKERLHHLLEGLGWDGATSVLPPTLPGLISDLHGWVTTGAGGMENRMHVAAHREGVLEAITTTLFVAPVLPGSDKAPEVREFTPDLQPLVALVRAGWARHGLLAHKAVSTVDLALVAGVVACRIRQVVQAGELKATPQRGNHPAVIAPKEATRWLLTRGINLTAKPPAETPSAV